MTRYSDQVELVAGGVVLRTWLEYSVDSKLLTPADGFTMAVAAADRARREELREALQPGKRVQLFIGSPDVGTGATIRQRGSLQLTGIIDSLDIKGDRGAGALFSVEGRDLAGALVDASVPVDLIRSSGTRLVDLVASAIAPWSSEPYRLTTVATDDTVGRDILTGRGDGNQAGRRRRNQARAHGIRSESFTRRARLAAEAARAPVSEYALANVDARTRRGSASGLVADDIARLTIRDARPRAGESVWEYIDRHARRLGVLMWLSPDGKLVLGSIRYDQPALYKLIRRERSDPNEPNNILSGGAVRNAADRVSSVTVYGRTRGENLERAASLATATDPEMAELGLLRPLIVQDGSIRTEEEAERRARRELAKGRANALVLRYTMAHHGQGRSDGTGPLYATHRIAAVDDEIAGIRGEYFITDRTFTKSREHGTRTELLLVEKGSIVL